MTRAGTGYFSRMSDAPDPDLQPAPAGPGRCARCHQASDVLVLDARGLVSTACVDHLEWAFLTDVDAWTGRWRTT